MDTLGLVQFYCYTEVVLLSGEIVLTWSVGTAELIPLNVLYPLFRGSFTKSTLYIVNRKT